MHYGDHLTSQMRYMQEINHNALMESFEYRGVDPGQLSAHVFIS